MKRLDSICSFLFYFFVFIAFFTYGCACPPTKEIADAEVALQDAQSAGAEVYALKEYKSAESKLEDAREEMTAVHYGSARALALESKEKALLAKEKTEHEKRRLKEEAAEQLKSAHAALSATSLAGGEEYDPEVYKGLVALIEEAENAFSEGKYYIAIEKAKEAEYKARRLTLASKRAFELETKEAQEKDKTDVKPSVAPLPGLDKATVPDSHIVQKGECLWSISEYERIYADPFMWPLIYKANRSHIDDPDLIFPRQQLKIPRNNNPKDIEESISKAKTRGVWSLNDGK